MVESSRTAKEVAADLRRKAPGLRGGWTMPTEPGDLDDVSDLMEEAAAILDDS